MQATVQKYIDAAISKTLNLPEDISVDDFKEVYMQAYDMGCKGCTTYRPNDVTGAVLSTNSSKEAAPAAKDDQSLGIDIIRPEELPGSTYKLDYPEEGSAMYITINDVIDGGRRRPFEMFINSRKMDHFAWTVALTRMISAIFRRGGDISFVVEELKAVFDPRGGHWMGGRYIPSLLAAIGDTLMLHLDQIGYLSASSEPLTALAPPAVHDCSSHSAAPKILGRTCGSCGQPSVYDLGGCPTCTSCGASKCA
jgi:ribonucleoside-diphosphate reductase alpha chain